MANRSKRREGRKQLRISGIEVVGVAAIAFAVVAGIILLMTRGAGRPTVQVPTPTVRTASVATPIPQREGVGTTPAGYPYKGSPQAKVTMIEFSDYT